MAPPRPARARNPPGRGRALGDVRPGALVRELSGRRTRLAAGLRPLQRALRRRRRGRDLRGRRTRDSRRDLARAARRADCDARLPGVVGAARGVAPDGARRARHGRQRDQRDAARRDGRSARRPAADRGPASGRGSGTRRRNRGDAMSAMAERSYTGLGARVPVGDLVPSPRHAARVWQRNARVFSKVWRGALLPQFLDPLFYLVALGFGLGTYVATVNGIPYKDFIAPGLIASAAMWAASFETTYNV